MKCSEIAVFLKGATCPLPSKEYVVEQQSFHLSNLPGFLTALVPEVSTNDSESEIRTSLKEYGRC